MTDSQLRYELQHQSLYGHVQPCMISPDASFASSVKESKEQL